MTLFFPALAPFTPCFLHIVDVSGERADVLVDETLTALGEAVLWCLSVAGDDERFEREIDGFGALLREVLEAQDGLAALRALLRYLVATHEGMGAKKVCELVKATGPKAEEGAVTWLEEIKLEGIREGKLEGKREGQAQLLLVQLAARFGELPAEVVTRVSAADDTALSRWAVRVLQAPTVADVLDGGVPASIGHASPPKA